MWTYRTKILFSHLTCFRNLLEFHLLFSAYYVVCSVHMYSRSTGHLCTWNVHSYYTVHSAYTVHTLCVYTPRVLHVHRVLRTCYTGCVHDTHTCGTHTHTHTLTFAWRQACAIIFLGGRDHCLVFFVPHATNHLINICVLTTTFDTFPSCPILWTTILGHWSIRVISFSNF